MEGATLAPTNIMSAFTYKARDMNGLVVMGQIDGDTIEVIRDKLAERGLIPISVSKGANRIAQEANLKNLFQTVSNEELMLFTRQVHTLFKAGMDIETLLSTLAAQTRNKFFADSINRIKTDVAAGSSLSRAFGQHPKVFNELYTNMLATGEEAGILDQSLAQLCTLIEKEYTLKSSVKSAMLYPKIVIFVLCGAFITMMTFVVPKFAKFFAHFNAELPLPTRLMIGMSEFLVNYWYIALMAFGGLVFAFKKWTSTTKGRFIWDKLKWKLPIFGPLGQKVANARFANIIASLYKAGLPITRGLEITSKTIGNEVFSQEVMTVKADVEKGKSISEAMRDKGNFSPLIVEATAIGEKSGALDEMYTAIGGHYDQEVQHTLKNLTTLIEPLLLFMVFGMVTVFALAIFLPMWSLSKVVKGH